MDAVEAADAAAGDQSEGDESHTQIATLQFWLKREEVGTQRRSDATDSQQH